MSKPKILYLVTEDSYFCSHRLPLAKAAQEAGYEILVATRLNRHEEPIRKAGFSLLPLGLRRLGTNPFVEAWSFWQILKLYLTYRPDIVHHVGLKPIIYGSLAARLTGIKRVVNAVAGLGQVTAANPNGPVASHGWVLKVYRWVMSGSVAVAQNEDDLRVLIAAGATTEKSSRLIRGSGVDVAAFSPTPEPEGLPVVMISGRMIWAKGVGDFVEAVKLLKHEGVAARFVLVGEPDTGNISPISESQLKAWGEEGLVEWWGRSEDMPESLAKSHIICLPSRYGEGVPKSLIEAAACARPIVTTDTPGCRDIVEDGKNGLLVSVGDVKGLAQALKRLIGDKNLRISMGRQGRDIAVNKFSAQIVHDKFLELYGELAPLKARTTA